MVAKDSKASANYAVVKDIRSVTAGKRKRIPPKGHLIGSRLSIPTKMKMMILRL